MTQRAHLRGSAIWINFPRVVCRSWVHWSDVDGRPVPVVLMGDAAHTAHFSIGSGTKLALEDAIALARAIGEHAATCAPRSPRTRRSASVEVLKIQNAARNSTEWFENVDALHGARGRAVRLQPADAQPAHLAREPAPARPGVRRRDGSAGSREPRAAAGAPCRRCSRRSRCAASRCRTASSSRRWRSTRAATACPTTTTSCISAAARTAAPGWCSPK